MGNTSERFLRALLVTMLPPQLEIEVAELRTAYSIDIVEEPSVINIVFRDFNTSNLYNKPRTNLLLRVPRAYPDAGLDMVWTDPELLLQDNTVPNGASAMEIYPALDSIS